ncbi:hypothetical protein GJAV_G00015110 [Gymnothorax javanicus]|nr:hypothetical protein GJAV_G00015110 [Gymnothorax javanicus]
MIGKDDSMQSLGIIPCAISWLFKLINERKEKTGARFSVRVSAVEVWGKDENLKDLLSEVATGSLQDGQSPGVYLCEDPICGMQLQNQSELRAPSAEKAAFFLDAAIASRSSSRPDCNEEEKRNSHMLFTLHIYQYRMEKTSKGGTVDPARNPTRLSQLEKIEAVLQHHEAMMSAAASDTRQSFTALAPPAPPRSIASEQAKVAFTINHLTGRARLWGAAEWERQSPVLRRGVIATWSRWNTAAQMDAFLHGLDDYLKDELVSYKVPPTLDGIIELVIRIDLRIHAHRRERRQGALHCQTPA